jgi:hypothetical protein
MLPASALLAQRCLDPAPLSMEFDESFAAG